MVRNTLIQLVTLLAAITLCAGESIFCGTYEKEVSPDNKALIEVLLAMGYSAEKAQNIAKAPMTMTIKENPDKTYAITTVSPVKNHTLIITPGNEFEDKLIDGRSYKGTVTIVAKNKVHGMKRIGDVEVKTECEYSAEGIKATVNVNGKTATCNWKRTSPLKL